MYNIRKTKQVFQKASTLEMVQNALSHLNQKKSAPPRAGKVVNIQAKNNKANIHANNKVLLHTSSEQKSTLL